jgi:hypothetical protein
MNKPLLIGDVTDLAAFEPAIKLQAISADLGNRYFSDYILTQDLATLYTRIFSSILGDEWGNTASKTPAEQLRSHLIAAQYGTGKSYFLMVLSALLRAGGDAARLQTAKRKFETFPDVQKQLAQLANEKFLIIQISAEDKGDTRFRELLVRSLLDEVIKILPDATFSNEYTLAIEQLEELEKPEFVSVKQRFVQVLEEHFHISLQQLRARLGGYDRASLRAYYQGWERAVGLRVSRDALNPETTFQEALDLLKAKGYTHIAILVDELTAYLTASAGHHSLADTLGELQTFAAFCNKPTSHCLFVAAMHVDLETFLKEKSQQRDFEKMRGRFSQHAFPIYSSKLLAGVFRPKPTFAQVVGRHRSQAESLNRLIEDFKMVDDGKCMDLSAFFPLHPAVAHYLPLIARELGQAERTSFGFVDEVVRKKLREPLVVEGRLNLITLDQVFDYFLPAMERKPQYLQVISAFNIIQSKLASPLAHRSFKVLALLWIASHVHTEETYYLQVDLTEGQVASFIGAEEDRSVAEALKSLTETSYVYFDRSTKKYFYVHGDVGWNLESEIQEGMANLDTDADEILRNALQTWGHRGCLQVPDSVIVKVERSIESQRIDLEHLKQTVSLKPKHAEGLVVFVMPRFSDEMERYESVFSDVSLKARSLSASNVIVAIPKKVDMLNRTELLRYRALQEIGRQLDLGKPGASNEQRVRMTRARFAEVEARVQSDVESFGQVSNFIFFTNRQPLEAQSLDTILEGMFERYYYKFPKVKVERINSRQTTNPLIQSCIVNPRTTFSSDTSEVARQARDTLQVLGLCSWEKAAGGKYVVELKEPEQGEEGYEIWRMVLDTLTGTAQSPFSTLYKRLSAPPYGLPDYVVELYVAAVRALKKVHILDSEGTMPPVGTALVLDITKYKDKRFQVVPVQETGVPYTFICSVWQAIDEPLGLRNYQELEKNLGRNIDDQKTWFALKQDSNNLLQNRFGQVGENLKAIEAESAQFTVLVEHLEQIRRLFIPAQGFEQLATLGEQLSTAKLKDNPDAAALAIHQTIESVEQFLSDWPTLQPTYRQYKRLQQTAGSTSFSSLLQVLDEAWRSYSSEALSAEKRKQFIEEFQKLWEQYTERYVDEHNAVATARAAYGKGVEESLPYELIGEFAQFAFGGIVTRSNFHARIGEVRQQACQPLTKDSMLDYRQFGRATCPTCNYRLGTDTEILAQLQKGEESLAISVSNALSSYLTRMEEQLAAESVRLYIQEKASSEERTTIVSVQNLVGKGQELTAAQHRKLRALLPNLGPVLSKAAEYARAQARKREEFRKQLEEEEERKRRPRLPTVQLGESIQTFLLASGLESMTWEELERRLLTWKQEIAKEFKPQV